MFALLTQPKHNLQVLRIAGAGVASFVVAGWLALLLYLNLPLVYDYHRETTDAKYFYYALFLAAPLFALFDWRSVLVFLRTPLCKWSIFTLCVFLLNYARLVYLEFPFDDIDEEIDRIQRFMMLPVIAYLAFKVNRSHIIFFLKISVFVGPLFLLVDFFIPGALDNPTDELGQGSGRADGLYFNPNPAAEAPLLCLLLVRRHFSSKALMFIYVLVGLGIVFTFSRSGMGMWLLLGAILIFSGRLPKIVALIPVILFVSLGSLSILLSDYLESIPGYEYKIDNLVSRLNFFADADIDVLDVGSKENSSRSELAVEAIGSALEKPFIGHGITYVHDTYENEAHNQLLWLWHLFGIPGVASWIWLLVILFNTDKANRLWLRPAVWVFVWFSMFSHNLLDHVFWLVYIALTVFLDYSDPGDAVPKHLRKPVENTKRAALKSASDVGKKGRRKRKRKSKHGTENSDSKSRDIDKGIGDTKIDVTL